MRGFIKACVLSTTVALVARRAWLVRRLRESWAGVNSRAVC